MKLFSKKRILEAMRIRRVHYELSLTGKEVGLNNERRVVNAFTTEFPYQNKPPWIHGVELSTDYEDRILKGDVVFTTDVGPILLQVKSSLANVFMFERAQREGRISRDILVVKVEPADTPVAIVKKVLPLVSRARIMRLKKVH